MPSLNVNTWMVPLALRMGRTVHQPKSTLAHKGVSKWGLVRAQQTSACWMTTTATSLSMVIAPRYRGHVNDLHARSIRAAGCPGPSAVVAGDGHAGCDPLP